MHTLSVSIQQTVEDFRVGCSEWEREFRSLLNDIDDFLATETSADAEPVPLVTTTVAADIVGLKGLVEQQTEVLTALVNALTGPPAAIELASGHDEQVASPAPSEVDPFERLQRVVADATRAN